MRKTLRTETIANELRGNSAFFPHYKEEPTPSSSSSPLPNHSPQIPDTRTGERANGSSPERSGKQPGKRIATRNSFDIYEDQMETLRELSYKQKRAHQLGSMSRMVREAIDKYIKDSG